MLSFMKVLWPDFSIWHLYAAVLHYQKNYQAIKVIYFTIESICILVCLYKVQGELFFVIFEKNRED